MNKEILEERLKEIESAIDKQNKIINQDMANLNMLEGGKHEVLFWLKKVNEASVAP